jgi:hypothetical protein
MNNKNKSLNRIAPSLNQTRQTPRCWLIVKRLYKKLPIASTILKIIQSLKKIRKPSLKKELKMGKIRLLKHWIQFLQKIINLLMKPLPHLKRIIKRSRIKLMISIRNCKRVNNKLQTLRRMILKVCKMKLIDRKPSLKIMRI